MMSLELVLLNLFLTIIIQPLSHIFTLSLQSFVIPHDFEIAKVMPLNKSGDCNMYGKYCPICLGNNRGIGNNLFL